MLGLMQDWPLLVHKVLDYAAGWHGEREVISRSVEGPMHRLTYAELHKRTRKLASAMQDKLGLRHGDIIATMAWNTWRHLEIWYAAMGQGAIVHTLNPRLFADQLTYIINHAEDRWIFVDLTFVPVLEKLASGISGVKGFVIMTDRAHMPDTSLPNALCYEELLETGAPEFAWPVFDENTACGLCYTSGTTGNPKGVLYSHRSNLLHAMSLLSGDYHGYTSEDRVLMVVPMFHANAWSIAFLAPMAGADMVMPGGKLDGASIYEILNAERVTASSAVPTIWAMLLQFLESEESRKVPHLKRVLIGGSACPESLMRSFNDKYQVEVRHGWGMTEMSPVGSVSRLKAGMMSLSDDEKWAMRAKQGRPQFTVEMKITDDDGKALAHDGKAMGRLKVKGVAVSKAYFKGEGGTGFDAEGWFDTGDVATIDGWGFMQVTDRSKDLIKSGGEWISSIALENIATACPGIAEAAAIGIQHPKWDERPLLIIVRKPGAEISKQLVLDYLQSRVAKWWMPDDVVFVESIPHTATGKISKLELREQFKEFRFAASSVH